MKKGREKNCELCKKSFYTPLWRERKYNVRYCSRSCLAKVNLPKYVKIYGFQKSDKPLHVYKQIKVPDGRLMREHRWIMEQSIGRRLTSLEHVHHIDGNPKNNNISNLVILSNAEHQKVHLKERRKITAKQIPTKTI